MVKTVKSTFIKKHGLKLVAAAIVAAALIVFMLIGGEDKKTSANSFDSVEVKTGSVEETVTAQGKLEAKNYVDVGAQVSGQIKKLYVQIGDVVKKGDPIADIDPRVYEARVETSRANLKNLEAQLAQQQAEATLAKQQNDRNELLIQSKAVSQDALETSRENLKAADAKVAALQAQIAGARASLNGDETNLSYTKIYAPMDGTVVLQPMREGQTVNAVQSAPVIVELADLDVLTVRAQVAEADVMHLVMGMDVSFTTLGSSERRWTGTVRQIEPSPQVINDVVLYNALVDVDNKDRSLMTGMSTQMFFELGKAENVLVIPASALGKRLKKEDNAAGQAYQVRVVKGDSTEERTVHVGLMSRTLAEVKDGLSQGEHVAAVMRQRNNGGNFRMPGGPHL